MSISLSVRSVAKWRQTLKVTSELVSLLFRGVEVDEVFHTDRLLFQSFHLLELLIYLHTVGLHKCGFILYLSLWCFFLVLELVWV